MKPTYRNTILMNNLKKLLAENPKSTVTGFQIELGLFEYSNQKIKAALKELIEQDLVKREVVQGVALFSLV